MTEFALTRLRQFDGKEVMTSRTLKLVWSMTEELGIYLTACQLGITVTSILLGVVFEPAVTELIYPITALLGLTDGQTAVVSVTVAVLLIQLMHTVWGEQSPTYLGVQKPLWGASIFHPVFVCLGLGDLSGYLSRELHGEGNAGPVWCFVHPILDGRSRTAEEPPSRSELRRCIGELLSKTDRSDEHREEVLNALEIESMTTESIMFLRESIQCLNRTNTVEDNLNVIEEHHFNRFPLVDGQLDDFVGTIYVSTLACRLDALRAGTRTGRASPSKQ